MKQVLDDETRAAMVNYRLEHSTTFGLLFDKRHSSDYSDFAYCDAGLVKLLRPRAEAFIIAVEALTKSND